MVGAGKKAGNIFYHGGVHYLKYFILFPGILLLSPVSQVAILFTHSVRKLLARQGTQETGGCQLTNWEVQKPNAPQETGMIPAHRKQDQKRPSYI